MRGIGCWFASRVRLRLLLVAAVLALVPVTVTWAVGDELDDTFAGDGGAQITPQTGEQSQEVVGLVARDDVIIAAMNITNSNTTFAAGGVIVLLNENGEKVNAGPGIENKTTDASARYHALIELPNDEVLAVGTVNSSNAAEKRDFLIKRFRVDLQANPVISELPTAGSSGLGIYTGTDDVAYAAHVDDDGNVIVAGSYIQANNVEYVMAIRLNPPNYTLDTSFGSNGRLIENSKTGRIYAVAAYVPMNVQSPGPLYLLAGQQPRPLGGDQQADAPYLTRITNGGQFDSSYGQGNQANFDGNLYGRLKTVEAIHCNGGQICALIAGDYQNGANGDPNLGFQLVGQNGEMNSQQYAPTVVQQQSTSESLVFFRRLSNGKFLLAGTTVSQGAGGDFILVRLDTNRQPDNTFGSQGIVKLDVGPITNGLSFSRDQMLSAYLQPDGKLLSGGFAINVGSAIGGRPVSVITRHNVGGGADSLVVTKLANRSRVGVGDVLSYRLDMSGPVNSTFLLTDTLPSILTNTSYSVTAGVVVTEVGVSDYAWEVQLPPGGGSIIITGEVTSTSDTDENVPNFAVFGFPGSPTETVERAVYLDVTPPDTTLADTPSNPSTNAQATFTWDGTDVNGPVTNFECSLDGAPYEACSDPYETPVLASGPHTFTVRAIDSVGLADPTPATHTWSVALFEIDPAQTVSDTLSGGDGYTMTVTVPAGAIDLPGEVALSFAPVDPVDLPAPVSGGVVLGFELTLVEGADVRSPYTFTTPITLEIAYDPDLVTDPAQLQLYFKQEDGTYSSDGITVIEPRGNPLIVTISHLTEFALIEAAEEKFIFLPSIATKEDEEE